MLSRQVSRSSVDDHLYQLALTQKVDPEELKAELLGVESVDPPEPLSYLWWHYIELSRRRGHSGNGTLPISWADMLAWTELALVERLMPWEYQVLCSLDDEFLKSIRDDSPEAGQDDGGHRATGDSGQEP